VSIIENALNARSIGLVLPISFFLGRRGGRQRLNSTVFPLCFPFPVARTCAFSFLKLLPRLQPGLELRKGAVTTLFLLFLCSRLRRCWNVLFCYPHLGSVSAA